MLRLSTAMTCAIVLALFGCDMPTTPTTQATTQATTEPTSQPARRVTISAEMFGKVKTGMSYADVQAIVQQGGDLLSEGELGGTRTSMYGWQNMDGTGMNATFQNDKLVMKAQFGLK